MQPSFAWSRVSPGEALARPSVGDSIGMAPSDQRHEFFSPERTHVLLLSLLAMFCSFKLRPRNTTQHCPLSPTGNSIPSWRCRRGCRVQSIWCSLPAASISRLSTLYYLGLRLHFRLHMLSGPQYRTKNGQARQQSSWTSTQHAELSSRPLGKQKLPHARLASISPGKLNDRCWGR